MVKRAITVLSASIIAIALVHVVAADDEGMTPGEKFTAGIDRMQEGVDYFVDQFGVIIVPDMKCVGSIQCNSTTWPCTYLALGSYCTFCSGGGGIDDYCVPYPDETCTRAPQTGVFRCGNQFESTCGGAPKVCGPTATATGFACEPIICLLDA